MNTFTVSTSLTTVNCGVCGGVYAITEAHRDECLEYGKSWNCPYCKTGWGFQGRAARIEREENHRQEVERLERRAAAAEGQASRAHERAEHEAHRVRAYKGVITKTKKRAAAGLCPCCNRTFQNLARHMKGQHPDYAEKDTAGAQ